MKKWRHLQVTHTSLMDKDGRIAVFPADRINLDWLFAQYPKIKKSNSSTNDLLMIETHAHIFSEVFGTLLSYLEDNGWECFATHSGEIYYLRSINLIFKRLEDSE